MEIEKIEGANPLGMEEKKRADDTSEPGFIEEEHEMIEGTFNYKYWVHKTKVRCGLRSGYIERLQCINGEFVQKKVECSILSVADNSSAQQQRWASKILGSAAVYILLVDDCSVVLDKIELNIKDWYSSIFERFKNNLDDDWWNLIKDDFKILFRGILKALVNLLPHSHGNLLEGIAVFDGEARLFNMKLVGNGGTVGDARDLHSLIDFIMTRFPPKDFRKIHVSDGPWESGGYKGPYELDKYMSDLKGFIEGKKEKASFYTPLFWSNAEQMEFLFDVYKILWVEKNLSIDYSEAIKNLNRCFDTKWKWWESVPSDGPLRKALDYLDKIAEEKALREARKKGKVEEDEASKEGKGKVKKKEWTKVESIAFWHHCRFHYNDHLDKSQSRQFTEVINAELNDKFSICCYVYSAIFQFLYNPTEEEHRTFGPLYERLQELLVSMNARPLQRT